MKRIIFKALRYLAKKLQTPWHEAAVEVIVVALGSMLAFKKLFGFSLTTWATALLQPYGVQRDDVIAGVFFMACLCGYATAMKLLLIVLDKLEIGPLRLDGAHHLAQCCITVRDQDSEECKILSKDAAKGKAALSRKLAERRENTTAANITLLLTQLEKHLVSTIPRCKEGDLFLSVYVAESDTAKEKLSLLRLFAHHPRKDGGEIASDVIALDAPKFKEYECVKALSTQKKLVCVVDCKRYHRSNTDRHRNIQHYVGMQLLGCDGVAGFLNIEFSNHLLFVSETELRDYAIANIFGFKYLLEHHLMRDQFNQALLATIAGQREGKSNVEKNI